MTVHSPAAQAAQMTHSSLAEASGVAPGRAVVRRGARRPGAHREPGSTPWRTALRELVMALTFGLVQPWRAVGAPAAAVRSPLGVRIA